MGDADTDERARESSSYSGPEDDYEKTKYLVQNIDTPDCLHSLSGEPIELVDDFKDHRCRDRY